MISDFMVWNQMLKKTLYLLVGVLGLIGCSKDDPTEMLENANSSFAGLAAFNGVEDSNGMQIRIDGKVLNKDKERFSLGEFLNYRTVFPGNRKLDVSSRASSEIGLRDEFDFAAGKLYTFFFYGRKSVDYLVTEDDLLKPEPGHTRFRVVNLVDDAAISMRVQSPSGTFLHDFNEPVQNYEDLPIELLNIHLSAKGDRYGPLELSFEPDDHSINTLVIYSDRDSASAKGMLAYRLIELGK